jgi:hypothetical protein
VVYPNVGGWDTSLGKRECLFLVASRGIPTRHQGSRHMGIFVGILFSFRFIKIGLVMSLGPHGLGDEI